MVDQSTDVLLQMGWYIDTCLYVQFIKTNIRVGFDTAEPYDGHTLFRVKGKGKHPVREFVPMIGQGKRYAFELTQTVSKLLDIQLSNQITFLYSELTKAEVLRALRRAHLEKGKSEILEWWKAFVSLMIDFRKVELDFPIGQELSNLALDFPIRKNVQDYLHLIIAKVKGLAFITSDKLDGQIADLANSYYPHIYYWPDIQDQIPIDERFRI